MIIDKDDDELRQKSNEELRKLYFNNGGGLGIESGVNIEAYIKNLKPDNSDEKK